MFKNVIHFYTIFCTYKEVIIQNWFCDSFQQQVLVAFILRRGGGGRGGSFVGFGLCESINLEKIRVNISPVLNCTDNMWGSIAKPGRTGQNTILRTMQKNQMGWYFYSVDFCQLWYVYYPYLEKKWKIEYIFLLVI